MSRPKRWNMFGLGGYGGSMAAKSGIDAAKKIQAGETEDAASERELNIGCVLI